MPKRMITQLSSVISWLLISTAVSVASTITANSSVDDVLDAMNASGKNLKSLTADVSMADSDPSLGDIGKTTTGKLFYEDLGNGDARFRALFEKVNKQPMKHDYLYANGTLTDRDYARKTQNTTQMLKPGEKVELFKLDGPFPLPLGQEKDSVRHAFEVSKLAPASGDPVDSVHLQLLPHAGTDLARKYKSIDLWLNLKDEFPARVTTLDINESSQKQTDLTNVKVNGPVTPGDFQMDKVDLSDGWNTKDN